MTENASGYTVRGAAPCSCGETVVIEGMMPAGDEMPATCACGIPWLLRSSHAYEREGKRFLNLEMRCAPDVGEEIIVLARSIRWELPS